MNHHEHTYILRETTTGNQTIFCFPSKVKQNVPHVTLSATSVQMTQKCHSDKWSAVNSVAFWECQSAVSSWTLFHCAHLRNRASVCDRYVYPFRMASVARQPWISVQIHL